MTIPTNEELLKLLASDGYENLRVLNDGTVVGSNRLMFTIAIYVGLTTVSWKKRFCFENYELAYEELEKLTCGTDEPTGYVARRGQGADDWYRNKSN